MDIVILILTSPRCTSALLSSNDIMNSRLPILAAVNNTVLPSCDKYRYNIHSVNIPPVYMKLYIHTVI